MQLGAWGALLRDLGEMPSVETVEWLALDRADGAETDVSVNRNWIDPGIPFTHAVARPAHGLVVTPAALPHGEAQPLDPGVAWSAAEAAPGLPPLEARPRPPP